MTNNPNRTAGGLLAVMLRHINPEAQDVALATKDAVEHIFGLFDGLYDLDRDEVLRIAFEFAQDPNFGVTV